MGRNAWMTAAALAVAVPLSACGPEGGAVPGPGVDATDPPASAALPWEAPGGDTMITCGHGLPAFPASRIAEGGLEVPRGESEEIVAALADLKERAGIDAPEPLRRAGADDVEWALLWSGGAGPESMGLLLAAAGAPGFSLDTDWQVDLGRQDGRLRVTGWGDSCRAEPALPAGREWARVSLAGQSARDSASVDVLVMEHQCASGRDPGPYLADEPVVVETAADVVVYWTTERVESEATCQGNPQAERTVRLQRPLGERTLLDGSVWPPVPAGRHPAPSGH